MASTVEYGKIGDPTAKYAPDIELPLEEIACRACAVVPRKALECDHCHKLYCVECAPKMNACMMCKMSPWRPTENPTVNWLLGRVREPCRYCAQRVPRCDMAHHERDCEKRPRRCGKRGCEFVAHNRNEALDHLRDAHAYYVWIHFEDKETELE